MSEWISVEDRLPRKSGEFKVKYSGKYSDDVSRFNHSIFPWIRYWSDEKYCGRKITHWMPLLEPPEAQEPAND